MTENEFIDALKNIPYSPEEYASLGVSKDYIIRTLEGYSPKLKIESQSSHPYDSLIRLIDNYDMSKTEIGMIWFGSEITETDDYFYVGQLEVDYLCISKFSHEVVVLSCYDPLKVVHRCARNSSLFLDAIIVAAEFLEKCGMEKNIADDDQEAPCSMAEHCAERAGGKTYLNFYQVLLGCFA